MNNELLISCEHARASVPACLAGAFAQCEATLASHRGFDAGALGLAQALARAARAPLRAGRFTRLVIDLNRSCDHPTVFSPMTQALPSKQKTALLERYYRPWRRGFLRWCERRLERNSRVIHLSIHSFTPELDGEVRQVDLAWLYDPDRALEVRLADALLQAQSQRLPTLRLGRNTPYRGSDDGHTTALRQTLPVERYLGLELEVSQALVLSPTWPHTRRAIVASVLDGLQRFDRPPYTETS